MPIFRSNLPSRSRQSGQFMPMAVMVILSISIFMIGVVDVYHISRAKLRAQNLADAVSLYVAGHMAQAMNHVADRNEWLNHLYTDPSHPNNNVAGSDPCQVPPNSPPGLGCFAKGRSTYVFQGGLQSVQSYARLVQTVNQIQSLFQDTYNNLLGAPGTTASSNGQSPLQDTLFRTMPDLLDPNVTLVVYNSQNTKGMAANQVQNQQTGAADNQPHFYIDPIGFKVTQPVQVTYCGGLIGCHHDHTTLGESVGGSATSVGYMGLDPGSASMVPSANPDQTPPTIGAGAVVSIRVPLIGLPLQTVRSQSAAYVVTSAGSLAPDSHGSFSPTYWVKLGKP